MGRSSSFAQPMHERDHFYKYTSFLGVRAMLADCEVWWSAPAKFNDPFDMQREHFFNFAPAELADEMTRRWVRIVYGDDPLPQKDRKAFECLRDLVTTAKIPRDRFSANNLELLGVLAKKLQDEFIQESEYWVEYAKRARVYCVTEEPNNLAMWAHYAETHQGAIVRLRCVPERDSVLIAAQQIVYKEQVPPLFSAAQWVRHSLGEEPLRGDKMFRDQVFTKSSVWAYEREWRVFTLLEEDDGNPYSRETLWPEEIDSVYVGCRMDDDKIHEVVALAEHNLPDVRVYRGRKHQQKYEIEFDRLV